MTLPIVFIAGKKKAGKDYICDALVRLEGYHKFHIVAPWLAEFRERHSITEEQYEVEKAKWRPIVQAEATKARKANPICLFDAFRAALPTLPRPLCVTAVRFINEAKLGFDIGALVIRVRTRDDVRRQRFIDSGESLDLFDDPFEAEVDKMPVHFEVSGTMSEETCAWLVEKMWAASRLSSLT
jgi:hypothetical protein